MNDRMDRDPVIERVRAELRASSRIEPDARAVARVLSTAFASPRPSAWRHLLDNWRMPRISRLGALGMVTGALVVGVLVRGALAPATEIAPDATLAAAPVVDGVVMPAADGERLVPTQFVLDDDTARRVSIVGDFNEWKPGATPLTRLETGVWTATVPLAAGRHVYAFVLDDTLLVPDPRAPKAGDEDYGREGSVVMVFAR